MKVTLVSAAGKQLRIVQGIVDSGNKSIEVRKSKIIDFSDGELEKWEEWVTVLRWMVADPVGATV